ncbi:MAG: hypothetical protein Q8Q09_15240 [Deltaproteobacteria bacterium]|nr:hypothetical protein [Deltaproteobacteria bacterium]
MARSRTQILQERLRWLDENLVKLERDRERMPYLGTTILLAPLAGWLFGGLAALLVGIATLSLVSVGVYVVWGHKNEYSTERTSVRRELTSLGVTLEPDKKVVKYLR